jgi:hypothetical protein
MDSRRIEIVTVDSKRWACLHIPLGLVVGAVHVVGFLMQEVRVDVVDVGMLAVVGVPFFVLVAVLAGWLQATLLNIVFAVMGRGPILRIRDASDGKGADARRAIARFRKSRGEIRPQRAGLSQGDKDDTEKE